MKKIGIGFIMIILVAVVINQMSEVGASEITQEKIEVCETLKQLCQIGKLYQGLEQLDKEKKEQFWNQITDQDYIALILLLRCDLLQTTLDSQERGKECEFYISTVQQIYSKGIIMKDMPLMEIQNKVLMIVMQNSLNKENPQVKIYDEYIKLLMEIHGSSAEALFTQMELLCNTTKSQYDVEASEFYDLFEIYEKEQREKSESKDQCIHHDKEHSCEAILSSPKEASRNVSEEEPKEQPKEQLSEVVQNQSRVGVPRNEYQGLAGKNARNQRQRIGYHTELCGTLCKSETCCGATYTKDMGSWYQNCTVCERGGHSNNNFFHVTKALDEFYYCPHLGEIQTGCYQFGNCTLYGGSATLDTRVHFYSHIHAYCPGHEKPNRYTIQYLSNGGNGSMTQGDHVYDTGKKLKKNEYTKEGCRFIGWGTSPEHITPLYQEEEEIKNLTDTENGIVSLYAIWEETVIVCYKGNKADGEHQSMEEVITKKTASKYLLKSNNNFTLFKKKNHTFAGWSIRDTTRSYENDYYVSSVLPKTMTFEELYQIAKNQGVKPSALTATFYAVWDENPKLEARDILEFYEGESVSKEMLLSNIIVHDQEQNETAEKLEVQIVKLKYADGKLVDGQPQKGEVITWGNGMADNEKLNTWFLQLRETDSPVIHEITYEVTDSFGSKATLEWKVKVKYNQFPIIHAKERYFTLEEAQTGKITKTEILTSMKAEDQEDGNLIAALKLEGFDESEFKLFQNSGYVLLQASVTDRYGKESGRQFKIHVVKNGNVSMEGTVKYIRFINKENYDKNANLDLLHLSETEVKKQNINGGMKARSIWYTNQAYRDLITATLHNKVHKETWIFKTADVSRMKIYVKEQGIMNQQLSQNQFMKEFGGLRKV